MSSAKKQSANKTPRSVALSVLLKVMKHGNSLSQLKNDFQVLDDARDVALATEITNGVLRWRWRLEAYIAPHLKKKIRNKDLDVQLILIIAVYELTHLDIPEYATVNEAVGSVKKIKKNWAKALVNAVLRNVIRGLAQGEADKEKDESAIYSHPSWLLNRLKNDWPDHWKSIVDANNQRAPIWLRVNQQRLSGVQYQQKLQEASIDSVAHPILGQTLKCESKINVVELPGFEEGLVFVQDAGAQFAANILTVKKAQRVLDLCAAPGGKTSHILELSPDLAEMVAVDNVESRLKRVEENLLRLKLGESTTTLITGDASNVSDWWDGQMFDQILVDAPCSATGVIRRHPDIKSLRREEDIEPLVNLQQAILKQAWTMLAEGGCLLYVTCSVLRDENERQIEQFLASHGDASEIDLPFDVGVSCKFGRQILPGELDMDGFYYAYLSKSHTRESE